MGGACSANEGGEERALFIGGNARGTVTTRKTKT
jgi:hypothetical protein